MSVLGSMTANIFSWNRIIIFFNKGAEYSLYVINIFSKYSWIKPLNGKNARAVLYGFIEIADKSKRKPNKLWVYQGR